MKIQNVTTVQFYNQYNHNKNINQKGVNKPTNNYHSNPIAVQGYNLTFGRLFRSPENFYEQDFNKDNMPHTLHKYIYESYDSDFRRTIPPAQAMQEVFGKIKYAKNLDDVRKMYPDEPLFDELSTNPKWKSRTGVLGILELIKDDPEYANRTLFKNGDNDLGMYILKKIYIEGKTLEEINKDFKKDISVYFKNDYQLESKDYRAFGIKFPRKSYWNSFLATREDRNFKFVYIPREKSVTNSHSRTATKNTILTPKKRFEEVKEWEIDKIVKAVIEGNGNQEETNKQLKKANIRHQESLTFVQKYLGEINSVVIEKLHISPEMSYFFQNYEKLNKTQRQKFTEYMRQPEMNKLRSEVMRATIRFFFDVYGVDGNNDEFQELLEYAHNIDQKRMEEQKRHNQIQAEYDTMFEELDKIENTETTDNNFEIIEEDNKDDFLQKLEEESRKVGGKVYNFQLSDGSTTSIVLNINEEVKNRINEEFLFYPSDYNNDYYKYIINKKTNDIKYLLSILYTMDNWENNHKLISSETENNDDINKQQIRKFINEHLYTEEETFDISRFLITNYERTHKIQTNALREAFIDVFYEQMNTLSKDIPNILDKQLEKFGAYPETDSKKYQEILDYIHKDLVELIKSNKGYHIAFKTAKEINEALKIIISNQDTNNIREKIEKKYNYYNKPLSKKELMIIPQEIVKNFKGYEYSKGGMADDESETIMYAIALSIIQNKDFEKLLQKELRKSRFIVSEMSDLRAYITQNVPKDVLVGKSEVIISQLLNEDETARNTILFNLDRSALEALIKPKIPYLYQEIMSARVRLFFNRK